MSSRGQLLVELGREIAQASNEEESDGSDSDIFGSDDSEADEDYEPETSDSEDNAEDITLTECCETNSAVDVTNESVNDEISVNDSQVDQWFDINIGLPTSPGPSTSSDIGFQDYATVDPQINVSENIKTILDCYKLFVNDEVLDLIVVETNRFAQQKLSSQQKPKSRINKWQPTDKQEIQNFFSIILTMGLVVQPKMNLYWSKDPMFHNKYIASLMPRDRFLLILNCIHFSNNQEQGDQRNNRTFKIQALLGKLLNNFKSVLTPGKNVVIDESMVPFRGRLLFRQYIPNKSHKYGIKLYKLCTTNGYTCDIIVYSGKGTAEEGGSHSESIVCKLLQSIAYGEGRTVFADNFYSSVSLAEKLNAQKTRYCGTLRSNRKGLPKDIVQKKLKRGEVCGKKKNNVKVIKWQDKRPVLMLTTVPAHDDSLVDTGKTSRSGENIKKPECVISYNKAKKGVDFSDQMSSYHSVLRKGVKWYRKLAFELLFGVAVVNAWVIYNSISGERKLSITNFRTMLAKALAQKENEDHHATENRQKKRLAHTFIKPEGAGRKKRKMCKGCYKTLRETMSSKEADKKVRRVISFCNECEGEPGFCLPCFNSFHS